MAEVAYKSPPQRAREWEELLRSTQNTPELPRGEPKAETVEIEVSEILGVSGREFNPPNLVVVSDTRGQRWVLSDSLTDVGGLKDLSNIKPGKRFRLEVVRVQVTHALTKVFPL